MFEFGQVAARQQREVSSLRRPEGNMDLRALVNSCIVEQVFYEAMEIVRRGIYTPRARAVIDTAGAILYMHPDTALVRSDIAADLLSRKILDYIFFEKFPDVDQITDRVLISGAGDIIKSLWPVVGFDPQDEEVIRAKVFEKASSILNYEGGYLMYYKDQLEAATQQNFASPPYPMGYLNPGFAIHTPAYVHVAEPSLSREQEDKRLLQISHLPADLAHNVTDHSRRHIADCLTVGTRGGILTSDTHQTLTTYYTGAYHGQMFDELDITRLDPNSMHTAQPDRKSELGQALGEFLHLCDAVKNGGFAVITVGSGNNVPELVKRLTFTGLLKELLEACGLKFASFNATKIGAYFLSALNPGNPIRKASWSFADPRTWDISSYERLLRQVSVDSIKFQVDADKLRQMRTLVIDPNYIDSIYRKVAEEARRLACHITGQRYEQRPSGSHNGNGHGRRGGKGHNGKRR